MIQVSSPFTHNNNSVRKVMLNVQLAALPALFTHIYFFGFGITIQWTLALITLLVVETIMLKLRNRPIWPYLTDFSGLITVTGLVFCIPPEAPWWVIVSGITFAIIFGKHLYGGLGYNPFNPAMLGFAFLLISFPYEMTQWTLPTQVSGYYLSFIDSFYLIFSGQIHSVPLDQITGATPLDEVKTALSTGVTVPTSLMSDSFNAFRIPYGWAAVNIAFFIGGTWMLISRSIRWQYPVGFLLTMIILSAAFNWFDPETYAPVRFHLLTGGLMLAAFFIITDPVSSSTTPMGLFIYASGIAVLVYIIRNWGAFPEGIAFAVLIMNMFVPIIDQYTQPRVVGYRK